MDSSQELTRDSFRSLMKEFAKFSKKLLKSWSKLERNSSISRSLSRHTRPIASKSQFKMNKKQMKKGVRKSKSKSVVRVVNCDCFENHKDHHQQMNKFRGQQKDFQNERKWFREELIAKKQQIVKLKKQLSEFEEQIQQNQFMELISSRVHGARFTKSRLKKQNKRLGPFF